MKLVLFDDYRPGVLMNGAVCPIDDLLDLDASARPQDRMVEHDRAPGFHPDAGQPRGMRLVDRVRSDRGQVGPQLLARLGAFHQHAAPVARQPSGGQTVVCPDEPNSTF